MFEAKDIIFLNYGRQIFINFKHKTIYDIAFC